MLTYLFINLVFLTVVILFLWRVRLLSFSWLTIGVLSVLLVCTAVFDSLIILADIVHYDTELISGLRVWAAPIEDFFYSLVAVLLVPGVWKLSKRKESHVSVKTSA